MSKIEKFDDFILNENNDNGYYVEYCSTYGHGSLSQKSNFHTAYRLSISSYRKWTMEEDKEESNDKIIYVGVQSSDSDRFAIIYISQIYYDNMVIQDFNTEQNYNIWMEVAKKCLDTSKPQQGYYSDKQDDKQLSLF